MTLNDNSNTNSNSGSNASCTTQSKDGISPSNDDSRASLELHELMDMLPQELYDQIYDLTFTAEAKIRIYNFDENYGPTPAELRDATKQYSEQVVSINERIPHLLHVDRASRQKFAESYYGDPDSIFLFSMGCSFPAKENPFLSLMPDVRLITWHHVAHFNQDRRACLAESAEIPAGGIDFIFHKDIPALVNKRIGVVEKTVEKPAAVYIDLTI